MYWQPYRIAILISIIVCTLLRVYSLRENKICDVGLTLLMDRIMSFENQKLVTLE